MDARNAFQMDQMEEHLPQLFLQQSREDNDHDSAIRLPLLVVISLFLHVLWEKNICLTSLLCWNNLYNITSAKFNQSSSFVGCWNNSATLEPSINSISSVADLHRPSCYPLTNHASFRPRVVLRRKAVLQVKKLKISRNFILKLDGIQWTAWDSNK